MGLISQNFVFIQYFEIKSIEFDHALHMHG